MSGTVPSANPTPDAPELGPASGTAPAAVVDSGAAPAAFSSEAPASTETVVIPAAEPEIAAETVEPVTTEAPAAEPEKPASILGDAKDDATATEAQPAEVTTEAQPLPTYEKFNIPEGVTLDDTKLGGFTGLLGEFESKITADPTQAHAAAQDLGQKLLDMYVAEARDGQLRAQQAQTQNWERVQEQWVSEFRNDKEIGGNRADTSIKRMGALLSQYGQSAGGEREAALRGVFAMTGAGNNIEVLRFVNWAASRLVETTRPVAAPAQSRVINTGTKAQRLYKNSP